MPERTRGSALAEGQGRPLAAYTATTDEEIVARVLAGDVPLYEILMRRHNQRLFRAARAILREDGEVEDVLQEAYLSAYRKLDSFDGRARFATWLTRIAVNKALDRRRRSARLVIVDPETQEALQQEGLAPSSERRTTTPEQEGINRELSSLLERAIDTLPSHYRQMYMLREIEDLSTRETAECLEVEEGTVKTRLHRARALLRESLYRDAGASASHTFTFGNKRCDALVAAVIEGIGR